MIKKIFHKLLFLIPLFGLMLTYSVGIKKSSIQLNKATVFVSSDTKTNSLFQETEKNNKYNDIFFEEIELEEDFEFDDFSYFTKSVPTISFFYTKQKNLTKNSYFLIKKSTSLYDLFCNWKHHLS